MKNPTRTRALRVRDAEDGIVIDAATAVRVAKIRLSARKELS